MALLANGGLFVVFIMAAGLIGIYLAMAICPPFPSDRSFSMLGMLVGVALSAAATMFLIRLFRPRICIGIPVIEARGQDGEKDMKDPTGCAYLADGIGTVIKIPVKNLDLAFAATNLRIEAAVVRGGETFHVDLDRQDFLMLSALWKGGPENGYERKYHAYRIQEYTRKICSSDHDRVDTIDDLLRLLNGPNTHFRVRIHASHEFTGFGRAFEERFCYSEKAFSCCRSAIAC